MGINPSFLHEYASETCCTTVRSDAPISSEIQASQFVRIGPEFFPYLLGKNSGPVGQMFAKAHELKKSMNSAIKLTPKEQSTLSKPRKLRCGLHFFIRQAYNSENFM